MKVVINTCFGGFSISQKAIDWFAERGVKADLYSHIDKRTDPLLIECVEALGSLANGSHAELAIVEIPDGIQWQLEEYDGSEHIAKAHRTWG